MYDSKPRDKNDKNEFSITIHLSLVLSRCVDFFLNDERKTIASKTASAVESKLFSTNRTARKTIATKPETKHARNERSRIQDPGDKRPVA